VLGKLPSDGGERYEWHAFCHDDASSAVFSSAAILEWLTCGATHPQ
jgi:hypothetical protein